ncbi:MAG TPA: TonB-dependent receptor plug domain-containing protein, partial [Rhizomicrobium sp.]|nr:TonB-dependent receptor plug domain-containing protein [Rhizomicrobium sp.]
MGKPASYVASDGPPGPSGQQIGVFQMLNMKLRRPLLRSTALIGTLWAYAMGTNAFAQPDAYAFDIPAEPLTAALQEVAKVSGKQIIFAESLTAGKSASALHGSYTTQEALNHLLSGTDLSAVQADSGGIMVRPKNARAAASNETAKGSAIETVVVLGQRASTVDAREAQEQAPNLIYVTPYTEIRKLPDVTVAEAVRRTPGISLETDEGEGRYVNIRGFDADLNSTTFGGLRLPPTNNASPFGGYRAVTLDSIPIGLVGAITVTKSNLPSQDAEDLGGTIEITPKTAPPGSAPFIQGNIGTGYEPL